MGTRETLRERGCHRWQIDEKDHTEGSWQGSFILEWREAFTSWPCPRRDWNYGPANNHARPLPRSHVGQSTHNPIPERSDGPAHTIGSMAFESFSMKTGFAVLLFSSLLRILFFMSDEFWLAKKKKMGSEWAGKFVFSTDSFWVMNLLLLLLSWSGIF